MSDGLDVLTNQTPKLFFQLEEAILSLPEKPLYGASRTLLLLSELVAELSLESKHEGICSACGSLHDRLDQALSTQGGWPSAQESLLMAWVTEARSQYLLTESFYLPGDLGELLQLKQRIFDAFAPADGKESNTLTGAFEGQLGELETGLNLLSEIGLWSIDHCANQLPSLGASEGGIVSCCLTLSTTLSKMDLQQRCGTGWHWSEAESSSKLERDVVSRLDQNTTRETLSYLKRFAIERETWRHNASLGRLFADMETRVRSQTLVLDTLYDLHGATGFHVVAKDRPPMAEARAAVALMAYGGVFVVTGEDILPYELASVILPVYKVSNNGRTVIIPAYFADTHELDVMKGTGLSLTEAGWGKSESAEGKPVLRVWRDQRSYLLMGDGIERAYGTPVRTRWLPDKVINVWSVRGELMEEYHLPDELDVRVIAQGATQSPNGICQTPISTLSDQVKITECLVHNNCRIRVASMLITAVLPSVACVRFGESMLLLEDSLVPILNPWAVIKKSGVFLVLRAGGMEIAVGCQTIGGVHVEPHGEVQLESVSELYPQWASGIIQDLQIVSEAEVFALHRMLLEAS